MHKSTKIRRLIRFIGVMEDAAARQGQPGTRKFDIGVWAVERSCGTVACALGEAGFYPPFRKAGLKTKFDQFGGQVVYDGPHGWSTDLNAGRTFFGLTWEESVKLFHIDGYRKKRVTPQDVIFKLKQLLAKEGVVLNTCTDTEMNRAITA